MKTVAQTVMAAGLVSLVWQPQAAAQEKPKLVVMPLRTSGIPSMTLDILNELLVSAVRRIGKYEVLGKSDIDAMIGVENMKDELGCNDVTCAVEIGGALGATFLVSGSASKLGTNVIFVLKLIDNEKQKVQGDAKHKIPNDENAFEAGVETAVLKLFGLAAKDAPSAASGGTVSGMMPWVAHGVERTVWLDYDAYRKAAVLANQTPLELDEWQSVFRGDRDSSVAYVTYREAFEKEEIEVLEPPLWLALGFRNFWESYLTYRGVAATADWEPDSQAVWAKMDAQERQMWLSYVAYRSEAKGAGNTPNGPRYWRATSLGAGELIVKNTDVSSTPPLAYSPRGGGYRVPVQEGLTLPVQPGSYTLHIEDTTPSPVTGKSWQSPPIDFVTVLAETTQINIDPYTMRSVIAYSTEASSFKLMGAIGAGIGLVGVITGIGIAAGTSAGTEGGVIAIIGAVVMVGAGVLALVGFLSEPGANEAGFSVVRLPLRQDQ